MGSGRVSTSETERSSLIGQEPEARLDGARLSKPGAHGSRIQQKNRGALLVHFGKGTGSGDEAKQLAPSVLKSAALLMARLAQEFADEETSTMMQGSQICGCRRLRGVSFLGSTFLWMPILMPPHIYIYIYIDRTNE